MVWPAPVSRSSGGRSAVQTSSGTRACDASITAGWKLAAAVPDVHSTHRRPAAREREPERPKRGGTLVEHDVHAQAGVAGERERERRRTRPGRDRPHRSRRRGPIRRPAPRRTTVVASRPVIGDRRPRQNASVPRPRVVLVPGFTQTASSWARTAEVRPRVVRRPRARRAAAREPSRRPRAPSARPAAAAIYVGYSMGGRLCLRLAIDRPDLVRGAHAGERVARHRRRARNGPHASPPTRCSPRASNATACSTFLETVARPADVRGRSARRARPGRPPAADAASSSRRACAGSARARWNRCGATSAQLAMPVHARDRHARREVHRDRARACSNACTRACVTCSSTAVTRCRSSNRPCSAA